MWQSRASESHDALHATKVLRAILNKVEEPPGPVASTANGGSQCPLSRGLNGISPFEGGSYVCRNVEECAQVPAISQTLVDQAVNFDELPALDRLFTSEAMLDWSRFNCPVLFSDTEQPRIASMSFEE